MSVNRVVQHARRQENDEGFTLVEGLVAMVIFGLAMSVITTVILAMTNTVRQASGVSLATDQVRLAFQRLDKQVRYADAITAPGPGTSGSGWYVELSMTDPDSKRYGSSDKNELCAQWRVVGDQLQTRTWRVKKNGDPTDEGPWTSVATGITQERAFASTPMGSFVHQGLIVDLRSQRSSQPVGRTQLRSTFFARNTGDIPPSTTKCKERLRSD